MKFTLSWLKDHLETTASVEELAEKLSSMGLEVESIDDPGKKLAAFTIARVLEAKQHPNADRLRVCKVDTGSGVVEVVCGAPNARSGMIGVFAPMGSYIPGTGITLEAKPVRGVVSNGMLVSERELELSDSHEGIIELDASLGSKLGQRYADVLGLGEPVIEVKLTPNRPDCTGVRGIARDLAAAGLGKLKPEKKTHRRRGRLRLPRRHQARFPARGARRLPVLRRPLHSRRQERCGPRMDAAAAESRRAAADQCAGRRDQLHQPRPRPAAARLRRRQAQGRHPRAAGQEGREIPRSRRQDLRCRRHHVRDRRRPRGAGLRRHPRRRGHRLHARDQEHPDRMRLLRSAAHGGHRSQGRCAERCALSLRARRRSCLHQARPGPRHVHDDGGGRRQAVEGEDCRRAARIEEGSSISLSAWSRSWPASHCPRSRSAQRSKHSALRSTARAPPRR